MKRPMLAVGISYAIATWAAFLLGESLLFAVICGTAGMLVFLIRKNAHATQAVLITAAVAFAAHEVYYSRAAAPLHGAHGQEVTAQGLILEVDQRRLPNYTLVMRATFPGENLPDTTLRIRGWGDYGSDFAPGQGIAARVQLEELRGSRAFHNSRGVFVGGRMVEWQPHYQLSISQALERLFLLRRQQAAANISQNVAYPSSQLVVGITLGQMDSVDPAISSALSRAGVIHMVVVSGMHLSILVGLITELLSRLKVKRKLCLLAGGLSAFGFALLVGLSPSVTRALVMLLVYQSAELLSRRSDSLNSLGLALLIISVASPAWLLGRGLWLSFSATAGIIVCSGPMLKWINARYAGESRLVRRAATTLFGAGAVTLSAFAFCLPIMIVTAGWVSLISPVVNVILAPLALPGFVFGLISAWSTAGWVAPAAAIAGACVSIIIDVSMAASALTFATFALDEFWLLLWVALAGGMAIYLGCKKANRRQIICAACMLVVTFAVGSFTTGIAGRNKVELIAIEGVSPILLIRQGSAVVVGTPSVFEAGRIERYLDHRGIERLDAVIAYDHGEQINSGLIRLAQRFDARMVIGPGDNFVLGQMRLALPGIEVVPGMRVSALGSVYIQLCQNYRQAQIRAGRVTIVKSREEYAILYTATPPPGTVLVSQDGNMIWSGGLSPTFEPLGALIFGEQRLLIDLH